MDINIHGEMDGIEAAGRLSSELGISIIFMTGYGDEDIMASAEAVDPSEILKKPPKVEKLKTAIESAISKIARSGVRNFR